MLWRKCFTANRKTVVDIELPGAGDYMSFQNGVSKIQYVYLIDNEF